MLLNTSKAEIDRDISASKPGTKEAANPHEALLAVAAAVSLAVLQFDKAVMLMSLTVYA